MVDKKPTGKPNKIPSIRSSKPPCPGKNFPVSFTFAFLFRNEKNKSPTCEAIEVKNPTNKNNKLK